MKALTDNRFAEREVVEQKTLADLRLLARLTTRQVASVMKLTQPRITQIEMNGKVSIDQLRALANLYGCSFEQALEARDVTCARSKN